MGLDLFPLRPLGSVSENFDSMRVPVKKADRKPGPYPYYGASGVVDYVDSYIFDGEYFLLAEDGENLRSLNTPIAFLAGGQFWVNNHAHVLRGNDCNDTRFLCYALQIADVDSYISGSTRPKLTQGDMKKIPVYSPPLSEQRALASILGSLDDKIELNRRMNETLEAMARAIFKSWFVDFEPVRARADLPAGRQEAAPKARPGVWFVYAIECEGGSIYIGHTEDVQRRFDEHLSGKGAEWTKTHRPIRIAYWEELPMQKAAIAREKKLKTGAGREWLKAEICKRDLLSPGLPKEIADLFPDSFEDSELGEIPKGWRIVKAEELFNISSDTVSPKKFPNEIFDHYSIPAFDTGRWPKAEAGNEIKSNKNLVIDGAVLISKLNPRIPRVWLPILRSEHRAIASTEFLVVLPRDVVTREYLYSLFSSRAFMDVFATLVTGTSGSHQRVKPEYLLNMKVVVPPASLIDQFSTLTNPMLLKVAQNLKESQTLAAIRDALLPKLISGELRIPDAEKLVKGMA